MNESNFFYRLGSFFTGGKDAYTQTTFGAVYNYGLQKGEYQVDTSWGNLSELARTTPHLFAIIDRKATMYSNGIWKEYELKNGKKTLVENSEAVMVLENPNPLQNGSDWDKSIVWSELVYGTSIQNLLRISNPIPQVIWNLPMKYTSYKTTGKVFKQVDLKEIIDKVYVEVNGDKEEYEINNLVFFRTIDPDDPTKGQSFIETNKLAISNIRAAMGFRNRIITNDAALGFMSSDVGANGMGIPLTPEDINRMNAARTAMFGMQEGKSNIMYTQGSAKWNPMSYPTKDLMLFEEVDQDFKLLIDVAGLNDNLFSFSKASTFANLEQGIKLAYQDCIIPYSEQKAIGFTKAFGMDGVTRWLEKDYSHLEILKGDEKAKADIDKTKAETIQILQENGRTDLANTLALEFKK